MKNILTKAFSCLSIVALILVSLAFPSCHKSEPVAPSNEVEHKHHEEPNRIDVVLTEVSLSSTLPLESRHLDEITELLPTHTQVRTWERKSDGSWGAQGGADMSFAVRTTQEKPTALYRIELKYYAPDGELMNDEFTEEGEDVKHQHFFSYYQDVVVGKDKVSQRVALASALPYEYIYADEVEGVRLGAKNPIGLKGYIRFKQIDLGLDVRLELLHVAMNKYVPGMTIHPFYLPGKELLNQSEIEVVVPLRFVK